MGVTQLTGKQIRDQSVDLEVDVTGVLPPANGGAHQYILLQAQEVSITALSAGDWRKLPLTTIVHDETGVIVLSSNNFTLPTGTYEFWLDTPLTAGSGLNTCRLALYNETDSSFIANGQANSFAPSQCVMANVKGKFSISSSKTFSCKAYPHGGSAYPGIPASIPNSINIHTQIELRKTA